MTKISDASKKGDVEDISRLTSLAKRANDIQRTLTTLDKELVDIEARLRNGHTADAAPLPPSSRDAHNWNTPYPHARLRVTIDWPGLGVARPVAVLADQHPTHTFLMFIKEIRAALGDEALQRLSTLRVSRGPLVSLNPKTDYRNPRQGTLYSHYHFDGTPYYVLTHSSTSEKGQNIQEAIKHLGLDTKKVQIDLRD